jgi:flagellar hook-associated protein 2
MSTASTSALGSVLSALNNGSSGIDVTNTVASIIYADRAPERIWESEQTTLSSQTAEIQQLENEASAVSDSLQSLSDASGAFSTVTATSSNANVLTASAVAGTASGTHTVVVNSLAMVGSWYSDEETSSAATIAGGSFSITEGGNTTSFSTGSGTSGDTLDDLASAINTASIGVTASVVTDSSGSRLALVAQSSGSAANLSVSAGTGLSFTQGVVGANASLTVDGVPVSSATNTVTGAVSGLTLDLQSASTTPITLTLSPDSSTIQSTISTFVSAYNTLITDLNGQFSLNGSTDSEGVLSSDSVARSMQSDVLAAANLDIGTGSTTTLASLGITTNQDGTLTLDSSTLNQALTNNPQGVANFFQGSNGSNGYATTFLNTLNGYTAPAQGAFTVDLQSISNENTELANEVDTYEQYISTQQILLTTEYNDANIALQQLPETIKQTQALLGEDSSSSS